ncbi:hypothetical protein [Flagellimonas sp.]|uniref:hypothetical protein n=1 Tax=Flagellimonas sp. TaxID=2058762 RepID=UPI003F4A3D56
MKTGILWIFLFASVLNLPAQNQITSKFPISETQELVHVSFNESFLLSGEYFYYKFSCLSANTKSTSRLSKVGYLELMDETGSLVFKHKIKLKNGLGYGDFFVPTSVRSGRYKLIGYTQWMKNWGQATFFQEDIIIINPYTSNQRTILENKNESKDLNVKNSRAKVARTRSDSPIQFPQNKRTFGKRKPVQLLLEEDLRGNFSVSVRNAASFARIEKGKRDETNFWERYPALKANQVENLPELRGELISGVVTDIKSDMPVQNVKVMITVPGEQYEVRIVTTNQSGEFYANLDGKSQGNRIFAQVMGSNSNEYKIVLDSGGRSLNPEQLDFASFELSDNYDTIILARSIQNQIENAYFSVKPDTLLLTAAELPFYGKVGKIYVLDEYTRFPTIEETALEILDKAWLSKKNDDVEFALRSDNGETLAQEYGSLLIVDGIPIPNQKSFIQNYDAYKIESIAIISDQYRIGSSIFDGIVDVKTKKLDYLSSRLDAQEGFEVLRPVNNKNYFRQSYSSQAYNTRIPDQRNQLLWIPNLNLDDNADRTIEFYTSDIVGEFTIVLEGFTENGVFLRYEEQISVE